jgi:hypothetical protein
MNWSETCGEIVQFVNENGRLPSQYSKDPNEKQLGRWCSTQRNLQKKGNLEKQRETWLVLGGKLG